MNRPAEQKRDRLECQPSNPMRLSLLLIGLIAIESFCGCNLNSKATTTAKPKPAAVRISKIIAQGQILPAGGLIRLAATPGDTVEQIHIAVGDSVTKDQTLVTMRSLKVHEARVSALQSRLMDAKQQKESAIEQARLRLSATDAKLEQIAAQAKALERQAEILKLAQKQVAASESVYEKFSSIAKDPLTRDFVGALQLDQQQMAVSDAKLKYRQQEESFQQSKEAVDFEKVAAEQEQRAAKLALQIAESSLAVAAVESELDALNVQQSSAIITSPQAAVVVAINAREGEVSTQLPLIELADETKTLCEAEVVEMDASLIEHGQSARLTSPALPRELHGKVSRRGQLVGRPQLAIADPLAKVDYRSVTVEIEIDANDVPIASKWLQLQVTVEIDVAPGSSSGSNAAKAADSAP